MFGSCISPCYSCVWDGTVLLSKPHVFTKYLALGFISDISLTAYRGGMKANERPC